MINNDNKSNDKINDNNNNDKNNDNNNDNKMQLTEKMLEQQNEKAPCNGALTGKWKCIFIFR